MESIWAKIGQTFIEAKEKKRCLWIKKRGERGEP
jgi:hypothetical protein